VLHFDDLGPETPRLPGDTLGLLNRLAGSAIVHIVGALTIIALTQPQPARVVDHRSDGPSPEDEQIELPHIVFLATDVPHGGGGGGGNRQKGPIRHAEDIGSDRITLRVKKSPQPADDVPTSATQHRLNAEPIPSLLLDAQPLAPGTVVQLGLPTGGVTSGTSTGPGSGGGVGTGKGTGIGPGTGAGIGAGSGGGIGGGVYRPGGSVTAPRLIAEVKPKYTNEAVLNRIQGTVVLDVVVTRDGRASQIRVTRSLDPEGLDQQAIAAVAEWRFEPGRLAGIPVDVAVTVLVDFWIR
jgi:periplasmic protein TonB